MTYELREEWDWIYCEQPIKVHMLIGDYKDIFYYAEIESQIIAEHLEYTNFNRIRQDGV